MDRITRIRSLFDNSGFGLEIGPSFNPIVPKAEGYRVEILDHLDSLSLKEKYANAPNVDVGKIESVDYVSDGSSIFSPIGIQSRYDFIVASHVIEHTVDFIKFVNECDQLLKDEGVLVLAIPDKRYTFDCIRSLSTTGQILQAHLEKRVLHTPGQIFDEIAYNITRGGKIAWSSEAREKLEYFLPLEKALKEFDSQKFSSHFVDIHAWQFSPSSFRMVIQDLNLIGAIRMREGIFVDTVGHEFYITLRKKSNAIVPSREQLAEMIITENSLYPAAVM